MDSANESVDLVQRHILEKLFSRYEHLKKEMTLNGLTMFPGFECVTSHALRERDLARAVFLCEAALDKNRAAHVDSGDLLDSELADKDLQELKESINFANGDELDLQLRWLASLENVNMLDNRRN